MNIAKIIEEKLKNIPDGFGVTEVDIWLKGVPNIEKFEDIKHFFDKTLSFNEYFALTCILTSKYVNEVCINKDFKDNYEVFIEKNPLQEIHQTIYLCEDKSRIIDFSIIKKLNKLRLVMMRKCEEIFLPQNETLEMLEIANMPQLKKIHGITKFSKLKYLSLDKCNKLQDMHFIQDLDKLIVLNLSDNKNLPELSFLTDEHSIVFLNLVATNAIKQPNIIKHLSKLKNLKKLHIAANKNELKLLRQSLPNCIINGGFL